MHSFLVGCLGGDLFSSWLSPGSLLLVVWIDDRCMVVVMGVSQVLMRVSHR